MMKKEKIQNIVNTMPDILKTFGGFLKNSFDKNGQEALDDANGVIGVLVKLFGKEYIDQYFAQISQDKLKDFGSAIYLKASLLQAGNSIEAVFGEDYPNKNKVNIEQIKQKIEETIATFDVKNILTIFQPKYHPIVQFTKNTIRETLLSVSFENQEYNAFVKHFNENITGTIVSCFGEEDYKKHTDEVKKYLFNEREAEFLSDMFALRKIGFKEDEDLKYEETYGKFENITNLFPSEYVKTRRIEHEEEQLSSVEELIERYYSSKGKATLREIVFIIADFGKGKSVFLRQYASKLAHHYVETAEGYFPVYFNLRNFANYQSNQKGGVIADFMRKDYGIDIFNIHEDQKRKYAFLIDSLDESGELNKYAIENVINSLQDIQSIDPVHFRENRIIITSRPFDDGLESQIKKHEPYTDENHHQYFIAVHGFTKEQFNDWVRDSLKNYLQKNEIETNSFTKNIVNAAKNDSTIDIHNLLIKNKTLTEEELKRPIFAYMIYQLIVNNVDFSTIGKTGVYLSFLNLLTKDAKHINDTDYQFNLQDEIESRNILHTIAALWMYEKQQGKQGTLKKADIFRVLEGAKINDDDNRVLEENKGNNASNIKFLSHSYFGAKDDLLHFQHQSFAEMLLAEYYLKIFIKYALDDDVKSEDARVLLNLGEPTPQTVVFFKELLQLLKDSCLPTEIEKRKLLFPLMASLATEKHNKKTRCNSLYYTWLKQVPLNNLTVYPEKLIKDWCIDGEKIDQIVDLAKTIIESNKEYLTTKANFHTALFDREIVEIENERLNRTPHNIDKWLALLVGNILYTDIKKRIFFNGIVNTPEVFFEMMKNWSYSYNSSAVPQWASNYFQGIKTEKMTEKIDINNINIMEINFSFSTFKNININNCHIYTCRFDFCEFLECHFYATIYGCSFDEIITLKDSFFVFKNDILSVELMRNFFPSNIGMSIERKPYITNSFHVYYADSDVDFDTDDDIYERRLRSIKGFLAYGLKKRVFTVDEIIDAYEYNSEETRERFIHELQALANEIKAPAKKLRRLKK